MLSGLIEKSLRESWRITLITSLFLAFVMAVFVQILPQFEEGLNEIIMSVPFIRTLISGLLGMDVSEGLAPQMLLVVTWSHPIVLSIVWGLVVVLATRMPAGEIESGTIDVLLGWPVSRAGVFRAETIVWVGSGVFLLACAWTSFRLSQATLPPELHPEPLGTLYAVLNLFAVYLAVGGSVQAIATWCNRRGQAMGLSLGFLLASYFVQFLSTLWEPAERVVALSFAHYYQPAQVMLTGRAPWGDIGVLVVWGVVTWALGLVTWRRRSVLTV